MRSWLIRLCDGYLTPARVLWTAGACWLLMILAIGKLIAGGYPIDGLDLAAHTTGARLVLDGQGARLYDLHAQLVTQRALLGRTVLCRDGACPDNGLDAFVSPPTTALLYLPLALLPYPVALAIWEVCTVGAVVLGVRLLWPLLPSLHRMGRWRVTLIALASTPTVLLLWLGNDTAISLLLLVVGLRLLMARRDGLAGVVLSGLAFKPQLVLLIPLFLASQRRWRAVAGISAGVGCFLLISLALVGPAGLLSYRDLLASPTMQTNIDHLGAHGMISLVGLWRVLHPEALTIQILVPAALALFLAYAPALCQPADDRGVLLLYGATVLATVALGPHVFAYDGVLLLIPALIILEVAPTPFRRVLMAVAAGLLMAGQLPWAAVPLCWLLLRIGAALRERVPQAPPAVLPTVPA